MRFYIYDIAEYMYIGPNESLCIRRLMASHLNEGHIPKSDSSDLELFSQCYAIFVVNTDHYAQHFTLIVIITRTPKLIFALGFEHDVTEFCDIYLPKILINLRKTVKPNNNTWRI